MAECFYLFLDGFSEIHSLAIGEAKLFADLHRVMDGRWHFWAREIPFQSLSVFPTFVCFFQREFYDYGCDEGLWSSCIVVGICRLHVMTQLPSIPMPRFLPLSSPIVSIYVQSIIVVNFLLSICAVCRRFFGSRFRVNIGSRRFGTSRNCTFIPTSCKGLYTTSFPPPSAVAVRASRRLSSSSLCQRITNVRKIARENNITAATIPRTNIPLEASTDPQFRLTLSIRIVEDPTTLS